MTREETPPDETTDSQSTDASERQHLIADGVHAVFTTDSEGVIDSWSPGAEQLYGYSRATATGRPLSFLFSDGSADPPLGETSTEHWHRTADGEPFYARLTLSPFSNGYWIVVDDTTDSHQREERLERQNARLERQNARLEEFTDVLAHDLRNPLNIISGQVELAQTHNGETDHLAVIADTAARMQTLVDDLLSVARNGKPIVEPESVELNDVVRRAWDSTGGPHDRATLECERLQSARLDPDRVCELFENLFRNAIEHTNSDVRVTVGPLEGGFYVADDGPGVDPDRRDEGTTSAANGSGYGLSIVRTVANAHGWQVELTTGEAGGARFEFTGLTHG